MTKGRVVLAMSGGVDSSVAAYLLKEQGYEVIGLFMRTGSHGDDPARRSKTCCSITDSLDARRVADRLDIPFYALDFEKEFGRIIEQFADEYYAGRTPNPCVMCNIWLKFGKLWAYGKQAGADFVATGHYARIVRDGSDDGQPRLARALDPAKDQSYVLFGLRRELLPRVLLPVGGYPKSEIREIAKSLSLPVHSKPDSQEICFIPDDDYVRFVREHRPGQKTAGEIVDERGQVVGQHAGYEGFTIGQRRGLGIAFGEPRYVTGIEPSSKRVRVGPRQQLEKAGLIADRFNWHEDPPAASTIMPCLVQIRAQHKAVAATVEALPDGRVRVMFDDPQTAVTPGQVAALYRDQILIGGGWIDQAIEKDEEAARENEENSHSPLSASLSPH